MKIRFLHLLLLFLSINIFGNTFNENNTLIIRKATVLPVFSQSKNNEHEYLASILQLNLKSSLETQFKIIENNMTEKDVFEPTKESAAKYSIQFTADLVIYGTLNAVNNILTINIKAYDAVKDLIIANEEFKTELKNDTGLFLKKSADNFCDKIIEICSTYDEQLITIISNKSKLDNNKNTLIQNLLDINKNSSWRYLIQENKTFITIPFLKNSIIFVCDDMPEFTVESDNSKNDTDSNIKIFTFDDKPGEIRKFKINIKNNLPVSYEYKQKYNYEIDLKYIKLPLENKIKNYKFFADLSLVGTTSGVFGIETKFGIGVPFNLKLDNNFYFRFMYGIKSINILRKDDKEFLEKANHKLRFSFGFEHIFYIKNFLGLAVGIDSGFEFYLFYTMIMGTEVKYYGKPFPGYPSITISSPLSLHLFTYYRINLIIGFEPTLRFALSYFGNGDYWLKYIDEARGYGMDSFRIHADKLMTLDLFLYDMPIFICMRIKI